MVLAASLISALIAYLALVFFGNRWRQPDYGALTIEPGNAVSPAEQTLKVVTWNIGYAALGAGADFLVDGGKHLRVLSRDEIKAASARIAAHLADSEADVLFVQENAEAGFLTRGHSVRSVLDARLSDFGHCFWTDFETVLVPPPLKIRHGMTTFSKAQTAASSVLKLPQDPKRHYGFLAKHYGGIISRHPIKGADNCWTLINIHLSAFDQAAALRKQQIAAVFAVALDEYKSGNHVVIGGDWNMRLKQTEFPHKTNNEHLFWIHDFPEDLLPKGWTIAVDPTVPTVRTLHKPYVAGENYTAVIDGFVVSPNVSVRSVGTTDMAFADTDHHPVSAVFRATEPSRPSDADSS